MSNPCENAKVVEYFEALRKDKTTAAVSASPKPFVVPSYSKSIFTKLADEIFLEILLLLPYQDVQNFVLSGLTPIKLAQAQGYWKRKISIDLPFLWDLPDLDGRRDFFKIYHELRRQCFATTPPVDEDEAGNSHVKGPRDKTLILGLANRRRVWNTCSQIAEAYVEKQKDQPGSDERERISEDITKNSLSLHMPLVASPVSNDFRSCSAYFLSFWEDLDKEHALTFHFDDDRRLCCLEVETARMKGSRLLGERPRNGSSLNFQISAGCWITGVELNIGNCYTLDKDAKIGITGVEVKFRVELNASVH